MLGMTSVLGALDWNPTIRGILFPGIMAIILCGSSYLLLATNIGNRLGFLVAASALAGWMFLMGLIWAGYGIGMQGRPSRWVVQQSLTGTDTKAALYGPAQNFAKGWKLVPEGNPARGDAQATADAVLAPAADSGASGRFSKVDEYVPIAAHDRGGKRHLLNLIDGKACKYLRVCIQHKAHWFAIQVRPVKKSTETYIKGGQEATREIVARGKDGKPLVDTAAPISTVIMRRDLGSLRQPGGVLAFFSGLLFALSTYSLHKRDRAVMALSATKA